MKKLSNRNVEPLLKPLFALYYAILFMTDLEENLFEIFEKKTVIWWRYIDNIFFIWEHGEESLRDFINQVNLFHPKIKFNAEYSKEEVEFLDLNIKLIDEELFDPEISLLNLQILINF